MAGLNESPTAQQKQAILQIQKTLKNCYGKNITIDGLYGPGTKQAVTQVQQTLGVNPDGWAGPNTRTAMKHMALGSSTPCKNRNSSGALSSNQYNWYMSYSSNSASQPSQFFSPTIYGVPNPGTTRVTLTKTIGCVTPQFEAYLCQARFDSSISLSGWATAHRVVLNSMSTVKKDGATVQTLYHSCSTSQSSCTWTGPSITVSWGTSISYPSGSPLVCFSSQGWATYEIDSTGTWSTVFSNTQEVCDDAWMPGQEPPIG